MKKLKSSSKKEKNWRKKRIKELDKLWSRAILLRDRKCLRCGRTQWLNAHHIITRSQRNTRWNLSNGIALCFACHSWWHQHPVEATKWIEAKIGKERLSWLLKESKVYGGLWTEEKFQKVADHLIEQINYEKAKKTKKV